MSIVRRFGLESPEEFVVCRRDGDGCSDSPTNSSDFSATSSSSIGSDSEAAGKLSDGEDEVESHRLCEEPLDTMESLDAALPLRRGISKFYDGKCKSFTTLSDAASTSSIKAIAKSENVCARKRRNLMAFRHIWEKKNRTISGRNTGIGKSKGPITSSRSTVALAVAMSSCTNSISSRDSNSRSPPLPSSLSASTPSGTNYLTPLMMQPQPYNFSTWKSRSILNTS